MNEHNMKTALTALLIACIIILIVLAVDAVAGDYYYYVDLPESNQGVDYDTITVVFLTSASRTVEDSALYEAADLPAVDSVALDSAIAYQKVMRVSYDGIDGLSGPVTEWVPPISVSATASVDYDAMDSVLSDAHGSGNWTSAASGSGDYAMRIRAYDTSNSAAVQSAQISVWDVDQSSLKATGHSDVNGYLWVNLGTTGTTDSFRVIVTAPGYTFASPDTAIVSSDSTVHTVNGYYFTPTTPTNTDLCAVYGYARTIDGDTAEFKTLHFNLVTGDVWNRCDSTIVPLGYSTKTRTDADGYFTINLIQSSCWAEFGDTTSVNAQYRVRVDGESKGYQFTVPDAASYRLIWGE